MSTNISSWKMKELNELVVPLAAVYGLGDIAQVELLPGGTVEVSGLSEGFAIEGSLIEDGQAVAVKMIETYGVFSGVTWEDFKKMLEGSRGKLVAIQVWEGGEMVTRLIVEDGTVTEEPVEW